RGGAAFPEPLFRQRHRERSPVRLTHAGALDHRRDARRDRRGGKDHRRAGRAMTRILSIPAGADFLETLAEAFLDGRIVPGFAYDGDPLALASATIYVPTRRAARALRSAFADRLGGAAAILPTIRPLGEFDEDAALFEGDGADELALAPAMENLDRILLLAPLVQAWKRRLPAHVADLFGEDVVVPASLADA